MSRKVLNWTKWFGKRGHRYEDKPMADDVKWPTLIARVRRELSGIAVDSRELERRIATARVGLNNLLCQVPDGKQKEAAERLQGWLESKCQLRID